MRYAKIDLALSKRPEGTSSIAETAALAEEKETCWLWPPYCGSIYQIRIMVRFTATVCSGIAVIPPPFRTSLP